MLFALCTVSTMNLKTLWTVLSGQDDVPNLVGSLLVYGLAFLICLSLQRSLRVLLPPVLYSYAADFCFTMAICAYPYSHGTVRELHGHLGYVVAAVSVVTLTCLAFEGTASPLGVFQRYLRGMESLWGLALRVLVQILAAFLSYRLVYFIWSMEVGFDNQLYCSYGGGWIMRTKINVLAGHINVVMIMEQTLPVAIVEVHRQTK